MQGIRDLASIQSAIGRPYTGYYPGIHQKAAALTESLVRNHGFIDGNKRTAYLIVDLLLARSGYLLTGLARSHEEELEDFIVDIANNAVPAEQISEWFRLHVRRA